MIFRTFIYSAIAIWLLSQTTILKGQESPLLDSFKIPTIKVDIESKKPPLVIKGFLERTSLHESLKNDYTDSQDQDYWLKKAALVNEDNNSSKAQNRIRHSLGQESLNAASDQLKKKSAMFRALAEGANFKFDLFAFSNPIKQPSSSSSVKYQKYGLVLEDINVIKGDKGQYQTKPSYKVGPLIPNTTPLQHHSYHQHQDNNSDFNISGKMDGRFESTGISSEGTPNFDFKLTQEQDLYQLTVPGITDYKEESIIHRVSLPCGDKRRLSREMDNSLQRTRSSLTNLWDNRGSETMNVHVDHTNQHIQPEWLIQESSMNTRFSIQVPAGSLEPSTYEFSIESSI